MLERVWGKGNSPTLLVGMEIGKATIENAMEVPLKTKNRTISTIPGGSVVKSPPANAGDMGSIPSPAGFYRPWSNRAHVL